MIGKVTPEIMASDAARVLRLPRGAARGQRHRVRHHRLLHGRPDLAGGRRPRARARGGGDVVPRRRPGHRRSGQPAPAGRPDAAPRSTSAARRTTQSFTAEHAETLDKALTAAGVEHTIEFYPAGARVRGAGQPAPYDEAGRRAALGRDGELLRRHARPEPGLPDSGAVRDDIGWTTRSAPLRTTRYRVADQPRARPELAAGQRRAVRAVRARRCSPAPTSWSSTSRTRSPRRTRPRPATT